MSKSYYLGHGLVEMEKDNFENELYLLLDFNEDLNGSNGIEHTRAEAIQNGFKTTLDYIVNEAMKYGATKKAIEYGIDEALSKDNYYDNYEFSILENDEKFIVAVSYIFGD